MPTPAVRHRLSFAHACQHLVAVESVFANVAPGAFVLTMPTWTPGSYMVREYARHVEQATATDGAGAPLRVQKIRKDQYSIEVMARGEVTFRYLVYGRELTVRTNFINEDFALLQGAATFFSAETHKDAAQCVQAELPTKWRSAYAGGRLTTADGQPTLEVPDFDALVDTPLLLGSADEQAFGVDEIPHQLVTIGAGSGLAASQASFDARAAAADAAAIVAENRALWGSLPYERYVFLNVVLGGYGGLEHRDSSVLMAGPFSPADEGARVQYAGLVAHEHFHVWNIKRLRPKALGPFDYSLENYTPSLWFAEGFTAYYDDLQVCRAGLASEGRYLERVSKSIESLHNTPGAALTSLASASFDAWIKLYRRDENTDNTTVSYYLKGSLTGLVLDAKIRLATGEKRSLDDVMRLAFQRYSGACGFLDEEIFALVGEVAIKEVSEWLEHTVNTPGDLDYAPLFACYGLKLATSQGTSTEANKSRFAAKLGIKVKAGATAVTIAEVARGSNAYRAGLNVDDDILAIDEQRVTPTTFAARLLEVAAKDSQADVLVVRFGQLKTIVVSLVDVEGITFSLSIDPAAPAACHAARKRWLASAQGR